MKLTFKNLLLLALMLVSAALGAALRPTISLADERPPIVLATMVPTAFGDWHEETNVVGQVINPQQKSVIEKIYSQTLSRTYVNSQGYRIMLSIAYGKNQSDALQLHKPEVCYPAQGFTVENKIGGALNLGTSVISATRLSTKLGQRSEPVTYWTVIGDRITTGGIQKKEVEIMYAIGNRIPDGMLVRVSSIDPSLGTAYQMQTQFAAQLVSSISPKFRQRFSGIKYAF